MLGLIPEDDDGFLQVVELVVYRVEEMIRLAKPCYLGECKPKTNTTKNN
jgi:hypothetical protein